MRFTTKIGVVIPTVLVFGIVTSYFLFSVTGVHSAVPGLDGTPTGSDRGTQFHSDTRDDFKVDFEVRQPDQASSVPYVVADILVDDNFIVTNGADWNDRITEMISGTNHLLGQAGVEIRVGSIGIWVSEDGANSLQSLMESAETQSQWQSQTDPARLLIVITCEDAPKQDGLAQSGYGRVIVEYYHNDVAKNAALLSHEVGHLFGASHHEDAIECHGEGCVMDEQGYRHGDTWCDHHRDVIGGNANAAAADSSIADTTFQATTEGGLQ